MSRVASRPAFGTVLAAVLLPPLGVFIARGMGRDFWVSAALTLMAWLPGIAFAFYVIFRRWSPPA